jgi:hypothetical protein
MRCRIILQNLELNVYIPRMPLALTMHIDFVRDEFSEHSALEKKV